VVQFLKTIPILRIFDVAKAKEFYVGFLGFTVDWEHHFEPSTPMYLQVSRAGLTLHLSEHHGDACPGSTVFVWMRRPSETAGRPRSPSELAPRVGSLQIRPAVYRWPSARPPDSNWSSTRLARLTAWRENGFGESCAWRIAGGSGVKWAEK
jgi:hypothetical protein